MKKFARWALCLGLCLTLLVCVALADEAPAIHVQLDGQDLAFTDAAPQVKDQRTFLPFRAVFEAMGAEVDNQGDVITAVRGGKTLTMTLGQTAATVVEDGKTTAITMDVAPYVDSATWRTYVPVRFAAQAFGCCVGWDQDAQTAIIIDLDKLVDTALEGKSFTYLEKLAAMSAKYETGIWNMDATFDADVSMMGSSIMTLDGTVVGISEGEDKVDADMSMKLDMSGLMAMMAQMSGQEVPAEQKAQFDALKTKGVEFAVRGDMASGKLYMRPDFSAMGAAEAAEMGLDGSTWLLMDMNALMKLSGLDMDWTALMDQAKSVNYLDLVKVVLAAAEPDDAANDYALLKKTVDDLAVALSDQGFVAQDGQYVSTYALKVNDANLNVILALEPDGEVLKGYSMGMAMTAQMEGQAAELTMSASMNDKDEMHMEMGVGVGVGAMMSMDMTMDAKYTPGTKAPVVTPPEGATVVDYVEMLQAEMGMDVGIIGGADGPTSIQVG